MNEDRVSVLYVGSSEGLGITNREMVKRVGKKREREKKIRALRDESASLEMCARIRKKERRALLWRCGGGGKLERKKKE